MKKEGNSAWWKIDEGGSVIGIKFMVLVYRVFGQYVFRFFLFFVIVFYFLVRRSAREASFSYLKQARKQGLVDQSKSIWSQSFSHFWQFGDSLIDKISVWLGHITAEDVVINNPELIDDLLESGNGAMLLVSHLGNFEICQCLSQRRPTLKLTVMQHTQHTPKFNSVMNKLDGSGRIQFLAVTDIDVGLAMSISKKLSNGEFLAVAGDRISINNPGNVKQMDFLGTKADFASGPFTLALALGCPVLALNCVKKAGQYHISFEQLRAGGQVPRAERESTLSQLMQAYISNLEDRIEEVPLQWFNFFDFFNRDLSVTGSVFVSYH